MEYLAGGDLMTLLIKRDVLPENEAKFYIAECVNSKKLDSCSRISS
jgi:serine/threonine kinase 38